jgi:excisionase family DNA binding protein
MTAPILTLEEGAAPEDFGLPARPICTAQEVATAFRCSATKVRRAINDGSLPAFRLGRELRIKTADAAAWLKASSTASGSTASVGSKDDGSSRGEKAEHDGATISTLPPRKRRNGLLSASLAAKP